MVLAYDLARSVLEWHAAGSTAQRVRTRICVRWKRRRASDYAEVENEDVTQEGLRHVDSFGLDPMSMIEYGSEDEEEHDQDRQSVVDALEPSALVQDALNEAEAIKTAELDALQATAEPTLAPKVEDVEDASSLTRENIDAMNVDANEDPPHGGTDIQDDATIAGLKPTSTDPLLPDKSSSQSLFGDGEPLTSTTPATVKSSICAPLRRRIAYSDETKLFLDPDDLALDHDLAEMSLEERDVKPPSFDLNSIFPDLPTFGFSDTMTPVTADGRKKSDRKAEKDDPNKRSDDTTYTKLTPIGTFMHCKPTLISSLQPSKRWRSGRWLKAEEGAVSVEYEGPVLRPSEDITSGQYYFCMPGRAID
jgi:chromatin modification-related protein VID21